ncbi:MAG: cyclic pyranopterin monophosphate synthase MoaC [Firmicutes bacterium]|nr:cyclic pyranopterin monophosphate synthase MoaC [Bacillota bacterium]
MEFTHFNEEGRGKMVDVTLKKETSREAVARASISMKEETARKIKERDISKGDVLAVAQVAGILAAKETPRLIPMCHPLPLSHVDLSFSFHETKPVLNIEARVKVKASTGVEMEALTAVTVAALTVYDMCKAVDKEMTIKEVFLVEKRGGKSGHYKRNEE